MKNFKKLFASVAVIAMLASSVPTTVLGAASYSDELQGAYDYAYGMGVTTQSAIDTADMYGQLKRSHMAKMMVNYAKEVKGMTADTSLACSFTDVANQTEEMQGYIKEACQMGLMGQGITAFNPNGIVTRAQFGTVLSRVLYGDANNGGNPYYADHLAALKDAGIMTNISNPNAAEVRGYVMLMMQRADNGTTPEICSTPENVLSCSLGLDTCPAECKTTTPEVKNGSLNVSLDSSSPSNGSSIPAVGMSTMATLKLTSTEDVNVNSITVKKVGLGAGSNIKQLWFEQNGTRVSSKATLGSDSITTISFSPAFVVKSNEKINLVANMSGSTTNDQYSFQINDADTTAQSLNMNITTPTLSTTSYIVAKLTMTPNAGGNTYKLGDATNVELGRFTLANDGGNNGQDQRDVTLKAITFNYSGNNGDTSDLANLNLYRNATKVSSNVAINGRKITFTLNDTLTSSQTVTYYIRGDVTNAETSTDTYNFYVKNTEDINAVESSTDFRTTLTSLPNPLGTYSINGGDIVLTRDSSLQSALTAAPATNDVVVLKGTISVKDQITMGDLVITGTISQLASVSKLTLKIGNTTSTVIPANTTSAQALTFYGNWTLNKGTTSVQILANIKSNATGGNISFNDLTLDKFTSPQYVGGSQSTAIGVGSITSSTVTISSNNVTASRTDGLSDKNIIQGASNVTLFVGKLVSTNTVNTTVNSFEFDGSAQAAAFNDKLSTTLYIDGVAVKNATFRSAKATFSSLNIAVSKNANPEIKLVGTFGSSITAGSGMKLTLTGFSATDDNGQPVSINGVDSATFTMSAAGSATLALNSSVKQSSLLTAGSNDVELGRLDVKAQDDDLLLTDIYFKNASTGTPLDFSNRINSPKLYYVDGGAEKLLANGTMVGSSMVFENIPTDNTITAGTTKTLVVKAGLNGVLNTGDLANNLVKLALYSGYSSAKVGTLDGIRLVSSSNGAVLTSLTPVANVGYEHTVVRGMPVIALTDTNSTNSRLMDLSVTAQGNDIKLATLTATISNFALSATGDTLTGKVYKDTVSGTPLALGTIVTSTQNHNYTSATNMTITFTTAQTVSAGQTAHFLIEVEGYTPYVSNNYAYSREFKINNLGYGDVFQNGDTTISSIASFANVGTLPLVTTYKP